MRSTRARLLFLAAGGAMLLATVLVGSRIRRTTPETTFQLALQALNQGDLVAVASAIDSLNSRREFEPHVRLLTGAMALRRGDANRALNDLAGVPPHGELRVPALLLTGECLYGLGRLTEAESQLQQLVADDPDHIDAHRWLGAISYDLGANNVAVMHLQRVADLAPDDYRPHRLLGLMYSDFKQNAQAIRHYEHALDLVPPQRVHEEIVLELARVLVAERQYESALGHLGDATANVDVVALRGDCYWSLGQFRAAHGCLRQARANGWSSRSLELLASRIELESGSVATAASILTSVLERDPHDAECRYQLAMCWRQMGDDQRCTEELERWRESTELLDRLTDLSAEANQRPGDADVREELSLLCETLGRMELAEVWRHAAMNLRTAVGSERVAAEESADGNGRHD